MVERKWYDKHMSITNQPRRRHRPRTFNEKFWHNDRGQVVVWQKPNIYLATWGIITVVNWFLPLDWIEKSLGFVSLIAIIVWGVLEVYSGTNYFRRLIGALVLLAILASYLPG